MTTIILIVSSILFVVVFGIHVTITSQDEWEQPTFVSNPLMSSIPWLSRFVLPVIPLSIVFDVNWIAIFFISLIFAWLLGPTLTRGFLERFACGKGLGNETFTAFASGVIAFNYWSFDYIII